MRKQFQLGAIAQTNVLIQQTLVEQTRATLPPFQKRLAAAEHALNVLVGTFPNGKLPKIKLNKLFLPRELPVSFPSMIIRQRPDVRAAEALMHAASAQIGVATANLFPQFTLTGLYGWQSLLAPQLFSPSTNIWSMATYITTISVGVLAHDAKDCWFYFALAILNKLCYRLQNVADSLRAIETDARTLMRKVA